MFCIGCGRARKPDESYCAQCGRQFGHTATVADSRIAAPSSRLRFLASGISIGAAACVVAAICTTYSFRGADASPFTLHDSDGTLAFNVVFVVLLSLGGLLSLPQFSARLGLGLTVGTGAVFPGLFMRDVVGMFRSGASGAVDYVAPGPGFYWGVVSAVLAIAGATSAMLALRQSGAFRFAPTKGSALWAVLGLLCAAAWLVGTWLPWGKEDITFTPENGTPKTIPYSECCSLSDLAAQSAVQAVVVAVLIAAACLVAACLGSAAAASGILLAACVCSFGSVLSLIWEKPSTLAEVASQTDLTEIRLTQLKAFVSLHILPGVWITAAASLGLLLLAAGRGIYAAAHAPQAAREDVGLVGA